MNRLKKQKKHMAVSVFLPLISFIFIFSILVFGVITVGKTGNRAEINALRTAVNRYVLHNYASEGYYPPDIRYIQEKYGLKYDESKYVVEYKLTDRMIMPEVTVTEVTE